MPRRFLFDLTGLLHWYAYFRNPSGVQRVTERLMHATPMHSPEVEFVARGAGSNAYHRVDPELIAELRNARSRELAIAGIRGRFAESMRRGRGLDLLTDLRWFHAPYLGLGLVHLDWLVELGFARTWRPRRRPMRPVAPPGKNDVFFNPGDLTWFRKGASSLATLRQQTGMRLVVMVYDLFVFDNPEWFKSDHVRVATGAHARIAPHVDRWVTDSQFVGDRLRRWLGEKSIAPRPIGVVPMGWDSFPSAPSSSTSLQRNEDDAALSRLGLGSRPFLLFVGTLEPRKNLPTLLTAYRGLRLAHGENTPDLVIVGGSGWKSEAVKEQIQAMPTVRWLQGVRDSDLAMLYRNARFSVAPSFSEGWGLPVQESLAHGLPCIASQGGATPEAAHGLAPLFDPHDPEALQAAMARWVVDPDALEAARRRISDHMRTVARPSWNDAAAFLLHHALDDARKA
jgi:glycosyltransferase involved in cell wall biosynthesis